jgi:hypothetical protein
MKQISTLPIQKMLLSITFFILFIFCTKSGSAQICSNPGGVIYGLSNSGNIVPITVSNASAGTTINPAYSSSTSSANAIGYNSVNGLFYYFQNNASGSSGQFVSFNPSNNAYTLLACAPTTNSVNKGCVSFDGLGYYCLDASSNLCYYNIATNTWTLIGSNFTDQNNNSVTSTFESQASGDMAIDGLGNLWIVSSNTSTYAVYELKSPLPNVSTANISVTALIAPTTATPAGVNFAGIAFSSTGQIYMCTPNDLYILGNNLALTHLGTFSVGGVGGDLTSCNYPTSVLPVTWQSLSASLLSNNTVLVTWVVEDQANSKEYTVQRSADGKNWEDIGTQESTANNTATQTYSFTDPSPLSGNNYYRILQTDMDGKTNYSVTKIIDVEIQGKVLVWPNPAKNIVNIQQQNASGISTVNAEIFNQSGQKVATSVLHNGINTVNIDLLPSGYYIMHIALSNGENYNQKLIKL